MVQDNALISDLMAEIKISISEETNRVLEKICKKIGIKKTEFLKSLLIEDLKGFKESGK